MSSQAITFSNGLKMPVVGLGTWQSKPEEIDLAVKTALDAGYRHIDTAAVYGNEADIGNTLESYFATHPDVKREDIFLVTKLWCTHNRPEDIEGQLKESLEKLKTDYVDLYLAHMPATFNHDMSEQDPTVKVEDIWKVELYLYFGQFELQEACKKHNITLCAYAPIGSPGRKNFVLPTGQKLNWPDAPEPLENPLVLSLAKKYSKTPAQILLRHLVQRGIAVIPKSTNKDRVIENFQIFDFQLSQEEVDQLNKAPQGSRLFLQDFMIGHPEDPFKEERPKA